MYSNNIKTNKSFKIPHAHTHTISFYYAHTHSRVWMVNDPFMIAVGVSRRCGRLQSGTSANRSEIIR